MSPVGGIADLERCEIVGQCLAVLVAWAAGTSHACQGVADLAGHAHGRQPHGCGNGGGIGVVEGDGRRLAAELEADLGEVRGAGQGDLAAGGGRPGEGDLVDAGVRDREVIATSRPPGRMLTTPGGRPICSSISASSSASSGDSGDGFSTTVHPASSAGMSLVAMRNCGMFHGMMAATTPTGSLQTMTSLP